MKDKTSESEQTSTPQELISKAGKLNYSVEQTVSIVCCSFPGTNKKYLIKRLCDPTTEEYELYHSSRNIGLFDVENALYDKATSGDVDAQEVLLKLQVDKDVDKAIQEKFFPDNTECDT
ncbi:MAG: hypothetical protein QM654_12880 [Dysgonamonadaceae bacterium]